MSEALNRLRLCGTLSNLDDLRYTPAGIPVRQCRIAHTSPQQEAGQTRQISLELDAVAIGEISLQLAGFKTGDACCVDGFLSRKSLNNPHPVLHICGIKPIQE